MTRRIIRLVFLTVLAAGLGVLPAYALTRRHLWAADRRAGLAYRIGIAARNGVVGTPATTGSSGSGAASSTTTAKARTTSTTTTPTTTTTSATPSADPSGTPMPVGNLSGWTEDFADDFTEGSLVADPQWTPYSGAPAGNPEEGWWSPSHDVVGDGELQIQGYRDPFGDAGDPVTNPIVTGGLETTSFSQTYGKYLVRFRIDQGQGVSLSLLLWPITNGTHDEIDFAEDNGADPRAWDTGTIHYGAANTKIVNSLEVDMTKWHTLGVEWTPGQVVYTVDGRDWATVDNANVPALPMRLDLQTQSWACGSDSWEQCPDASTPANVDLEVDWIVAYSRS